MWLQRLLTALVRRFIRFGFSVVWLEACLFVCCGVPFHRSFHSRSLQCNCQRIRCNRQARTQNSKEGKEQKERQGWKLSLGLITFLRHGDHGATDFVVRTSCHWCFNSCHYDTALLCFQVFPTCFVKPKKYKSCGPMFFKHRLPTAPA